MGSKQILATAPQSPIDSVGSKFLMPFGFSLKSPSSQRCPWVSLVRNGWVPLVLIGSMPHLQGKPSIFPHRHLCSPARKNQLEVANAFSSRVGGWRAALAILDSSGKCCDVPLACVRQLGLGHCLGWLPHFLDFSHFLSRPF